LYVFPEFQILLIVMKKTSWFLVPPMVALFVGGASPQVGAQTLREAVCAMLEFEPELNAAEYDTLTSREDQKIARSKLLPTVSLNATSGVSERDRSTDGLLRSGDTLFQRQAGVSIRQLLYDGGTARNETRASRNAFIAQQYLEKSMIESRVVDLCEVYLEVLRTRRQIKLAELNVENHEKMRDMLQERTRAGGSRSDLALVQGRLGLATNRLATAKLNYRLAVGRFERLTGELPESLSYPDVPQIPSSIDDVDLSENHDYLAACEALEAAKHRARAAKGFGGPDIYIEGNVTAGRDVIGVEGEDNEVSGLVVASWDLFAGGHHQARKEREHFQVGKYEELKRTADIQRRYDLNILWQEREGSLASVEALEQYSVELDGVTADYREQFKVGRQELLNILDVQSEAFTAESQLVDARYDLDTSTFRILGVQGRATRSILGPEGCESCEIDPKGAADPRSETEPFEAADPDNRAPVTQGHLMNNRFDSVGPESDYESPREAYYVEGEPFPLEPSVDCKPKGGVFRLFKRENEERPEAPIFK